MDSRNQTVFFGGAIAQFFLWRGAIAPFFSKKERGKAKKGKAYKSRWARS